jgi:hypothetical protein
MAPSNRILVYPNPAKDNLFFNYTSTSALDSKITIYDLQGRSIINTTVNSNQGFIDISSLNDGIYMLNFENFDFSHQQKLIIKR